SSTRNGATTSVKSSIGRRKTSAAHCSKNERTRQIRLIGRALPSRASSVSLGHQLEEDLLERCLTGVRPAYDAAALDQLLRDARQHLLRFVHLDAHAARKDETR